MRAVPTHHFLWETLGSHQVFILPWDDDEIVTYIVQDEEVGERFLAELKAMKVNEVIIKNDHDPEYIERWTRTA